MLTLYVGARVRLHAAGLPEELLQELREQFTHANPVYHRDKATRGWSREPATIDTYGEVTGEDAYSMSFPRGGLRRVRYALEQAGLEWDEVDELCDGDPSIPCYTGDFIGPQRFPDATKIPYDHQVRIGDAIEERECALVLSAKGSGKTVGTLLAAARMNLPTIILVWERNLMQQWVADIGELFGIAPDDVGHVQGKKRKLRSFTLAMQQTLNVMDPRERHDLLSRFGFMAGDEVQRAAARTYTDTIDSSPCRFRVGMSGGIRRKDGKQFLIQDMFGDPAIEVGQAEMVDAGIVHDVEAVLVPTDFEAPWYLKQLELGRRPDFTRLVGEMCVDRDRTKLCAELALRRGAERGRRTLVFTHRVDHVHVLAAMLRGWGVPTGVMLGGDEWREEFARSKDALKRGDLLACVGTYAALGVGQNLPAVEVAVASTPVHGNKEYLGQVAARVNRVADGKDSAEIVIPWDRHVYGDKPLRSLARSYRQCAVLLNGGAMISPAQYLREFPRKVSDEDEAERSAGAAGVAGVIVEAGAQRRRARAGG